MHVTPPSPGERGSQKVDYDSHSSRNANFRVQTHTHIQNYKLWMLNGTKGESASSEAFKDSPVLVWRRLLLLNTNGEEGHV